MDIIETIKDDKIYKKYKMLVKNWEKQFIAKNSRTPSKFDIKEAPTKIRYAYKKYFELKSAALENSLSICDIDNVQINSPEFTFTLDGFSEHHSPNSDISLERLPSGLELNNLLSSEVISKTTIKPNNPKVADTNLSKKLFKNSKFSLRNPRKSSIKSQSVVQNSSSFDNEINSKCWSSSNDENNIPFKSVHCRDNNRNIEKFNVSTPLNLKVNLNVNLQLDRAWLQRVTGHALDINLEPVSQPVLGESGSNCNSLITKTENVKLFKCDEVPNDIVENSESDDDDNKNKFKPALKKRKIILDKQKTNSEPVPIKSYELPKKSKSKGDKLQNIDICDIPPTIEEFIPYEVETDLLPRNSEDSDVNTSKTSTHKKSLASVDRLEEKIRNGTLNDNYVKINIEKKVFVRGKSKFNYSTHKKQQWKKNKKALHGGMEFPENGKITCFKCGNSGHMARYCSAHKGDALLPLSAVDPDDMPTLQDMEQQFNTSNNVSVVSEADASPTIYTPSAIPESFINLLSDNNNKDITTTVQPLYSDLSNIDMDEMYKALTMFGHNVFRSGQEEAIKRILCGYSTLLLLSTGGGKSLCYQLPAYMYRQKYGCITLVVSPLVSLMEDQVLSMPDFLKAGCLHSNQPSGQRNKVTQLLKDGELSILLISPEALISGDGSNGFGGLFKSLPPIAFACIDEAHCVSQWSHNFRPSYLMICRVLREKLKVKTILGLTATASQATIQSVISHINIPDGISGVISNPDLPENLILSVSQENDKDRSLIGYLSSEPIDMFNSVIVYCIRRDECERIAAVVRSSLQEPGKAIMEKRGKKRKQMSFLAEAYHAGMSAAQRKRIQTNFMNGQLRIIVATVAFGMGINKSDIRCIIHYDMPSSFESYVQEVGRAGRDGDEAHCHVFVNNNRKDKNELLKHIYSNSVDRNVIRKLLHKVFLPCQCNKQQSPQSEENRCKGHEVAIPIEETVEELDLAAENISTLLCYLELHPQKIIKVLHNTYTVCKIFCYGGYDKLVQAATNCPPLAMALHLKSRKGEPISQKCSNILEFPVVAVAAEMGWESGLVKYKLKNLEWTMDNGAYKRSQLKVEFKTLGFRIRAPGDLAANELDTMLDYLHNTVQTQEKAKLYQLEEVNLSMLNIGTSSVQSIISRNNEEHLIEKSNELKKMIRNYFQRESNFDQELEIEARPLDDERVICDVRALITSYKDCEFTGRSIARIFQGISSPNFPALVWGRCKFWRSHMHEDFYGLVRLATKQVIEMRMK